MCTVTFIKDVSNQFILTSNRDEKVYRKTLQPNFYRLGEQHVIFPKDEVAGGTWIGLGDKKLICCLLNGADDGHYTKGDYRKSRGQVLLDVYRYDSYRSFLRQYDLSGIEPFTLLIFDLHYADVIVELKWNGFTKCLKALSTDHHHIWSSATLYSETERKRRKDLFSYKSSVNDLDDKEMITLHASSKSEDGFLFDGNEEIQTVSITQITVTDSNGIMNYFDLINKQQIKRSLQWQMIQH